VQKEKHVSPFAQIHPLPPPPSPQAAGNRYLHTSCTTPRSANTEVPFTQSARNKETRNPPLKTLKIVKAAATHQNSDGAGERPCTSHLHS